MARLSIQRLRDRLPLIVFILLFVLLLMIVAVACACATDHPMKAAERAVSAISEAPALLVLWTYAFVTTLLAGFLVAQRQRPFGRASPQELQRFLF